MTKFLSFLKQANIVGILQLIYVLFLSGCANLWWCLGFNIKYILCYNIVAYVLFTIFLYLNKDIVLDITNKGLLKIKYKVLSKIHTYFFPIRMRTLDLLFDSSSIYYVLDSYVVLL